MLHKEFGAYLIALGTEMIKGNINVRDATDNEAEGAIYSSLVQTMMAQGIDGERAEQIIDSEGWQVMRPIRAHTFATPELEEAQRERDEEEEDGEEGEDDDEE